MWRLDDEDERENENDRSERDSGPMLSRLLKSRTIFVAEQISDKLYRKVASMLILLEDDDAEKPVTVFVNSPGGSADSGFAIYDLFRFSRCPVQTIANGIVASSAVMVYLGGTQERLALPNARFLLHQPSTFSRGQASDIEITANEIVKIRERYNSIVEEHVGVPKEKIGKDADRDFWLSAEEAKDYGLVQRVVKHRGELS